MMRLLAMEPLAVGTCILLWLIILVLLLFPQPLRDLERWDFLRLHAHGLCSSSDKLLPELMPYANLVCMEAVSSPIITWR